MLKNGVVMMAKLTVKQQRFVDEYLVDLNATQAAIRSGYSVKNAGKIGSQLLEKTRIFKAISTALATRSRRTGINQDRVLLELAKIAFVNTVDVINMNSATIRGDANREDTAAIASVKVKTVPTETGDITEREVKLYDKLKALDLIGKHLGMFKEKIDVNLEVNLADLLKKAWDVAGDAKTD